eukprot:186435-Prymnesium_polylepis.2
MSRRTLGIIRGNGPNFREPQPYGLSASGSRDSCANHACGASHIAAAPRTCPAHPHAQGGMRAMYRTGRTPVAVPGAGLDHMCLLCVWRADLKTDV